MVQPIPTEIRAGGLIFAALCLLLLPLRWIAAFLLACVLHELSHIFTIKLMQIPILGVTVGFSGALISTAPMEPAQELLCAVAGPVSSLALLLTATVFPELAFCGLFQGLYNLLPLYPSDGGRSLRCILTLCCPQKIPAVEKWAAVATYLALTFSAAILIFLFQRWWLLILGALVLILKPAPGKIPCKASRFALQ